MIKKIAYPYFKYKTAAHLMRHLRNGPCFIFFISLFFLFPHAVFAGHGDDDYGEDEIAVTVEVRGLGGIEVPAIYKNKEIYLSVANVFDFIKVKNALSHSSDSLSGFYVNQNDVFLVDKTQNRIHFKGKVFQLQPGELIKAESNLYLKLNYFKTVFGLDGTFGFRTLSVVFTSNIELPAITEMKQEQLRKNVSHLRGEMVADTSLKREYPFFHFGTADWAVISTQQSLSADETRLNLGLGGVVAGGETNVSLNAYNDQAFTEKNQYYQWHLVNNDNDFLRQVSAGKIYTQATSSLYAPVVGVQFTNTPTIYRRSYGTYTLSNTTNPNWIVELYVNDVLIDYKKADASGFFTFQVPLVYGYTIVKLKFYGPYGEVRTSQQYISVPFNFLPRGEFEYNASGGIVEDGQNSRFSRTSINYGLSSHMTIGGGYEYLSSVTSGPMMPFVNTSIRLGSRLLLSGNYTYGVMSNGVLSYRLPSSFQVDLNYTDYDKGQTAIYYNYLEERKAIISTPIKFFDMAIFTRLTIDQIVIPGSQYTNTEWALSGSVRRVGWNFTTYASFTQQAEPYAYSILSLSVPLPKKIMFNAQLQYDYLTGMPDFMKFTAETHLFGAGYINLSYQQYFNGNSTNLLLGFRYDFSFARIAFSTLAGTNNTFSRVESASGSLVLDKKTDFLKADYRSSVGRGGIVIEPFLDMNGNGKWDPDEPRVTGMKIRVNGGRVVYNNRDSNIRVFDLEPYANYYVELDRNSFDNISWQIKKRTIKVTIIPNDFIRLEVPVSVAGEVSGQVLVKTRKGQKGQGQIIIGIYDDSVLVARTVTETDGYFSYLGLAPGNYTVRADTQQLHRLNLVSTPQSIPVKFNKTRDGDVVDGLEISLKSELPDTTIVEVGKSAVETIEPKNKPVVADKPVVAGKQEGKAPKDKQAIAGKPVTDEKTNSQPAIEEKRILADKGSYGILVDVYDNMGSAMAVESKLILTYKVPVVIIQKGEDYLVEIIGFTKRDDALALIPKLEKEGYYELLVIKINHAIKE